MEEEAMGRRGSVKNMEGTEMSKYSCIDFSK